MKLSKSLCFALPTFCVTSMNGAMPSQNPFTGKIISLNKECKVCTGEKTSCAELAFVLPCGHCFHKNCIESWREKGKKAAQPAITIY